MGQVKKMEWKQTNHTGELGGKTGRWAKGSGSRENRIPWVQGVEPNSLGRQKKGVGLNQRFPVTEIQLQKASLEVGDSGR